MINRAMLRQKPLDEGCYKAYTTTHEYGMNDERVFCRGRYDLMTDETLIECVRCGAYIGNAVPLAEEVEE